MLSADSGKPTYDERIFSNVVHIPCVWFHADVAIQRLDYKPQIIFKKNETPGIWDERV
jgi:hypothetical protein